MASLRPSDGQIPLAAPATRVDRAVHSLWAVSCVLSWLALVPSFVLALTLGRLGLFPAVAPWALIPYVLWDLCSLYISTARVMRGSGASTIPAVSLAYYTLFSLCGLGVPWGWRLVTLGGLSVFHVSCYFLIPIAVGRWKRKEGAVKPPGST
jgi:hypothetical protein